MVWQKPEFPPADGQTSHKTSVLAVYAPDGQLVSPYGFLAGHDALLKFYASFMKSRDKDLFTVASARMIGER